MELFGIHKGIIVSAVGGKLSHAQIKKIAKACAVSMLEPEQQTTVKKPKNSYKDLPLIDRKKLFYNKLHAWKESNKNKYPDQLYQSFFDYWTQTDSLSDTEEMRYEKVVNEKKSIFNFGGRLATFWGNCSQDQKNEYWKKHHELNKTNSQTLM